MIRLIRGEFGKVATTQVWLWLLLATVAITVTAVIGQLASGDGARSTQDVVSVLTSAGSADVAVWILGVLGMTTEFRHRTITATVLATPSRARLVTAKLVTFGMLGCLYALICVALSVAIAWPWLAHQGIDVWDARFHVPQALGGVFVVVASFGVLGLGFGTLVHNQVAAVTLGLIFFLVVTPVMIAVPGLKQAYPYTPGGASNALVVVSGNRSVNGAELLPGPAALLLLLAWALVPAALGARFTLRADIT